MKYNLQCPGCKRKSYYQCAYIKTYLNRRFECHHCRTRFGVGITPFSVLFYSAGAAFLGVILAHPIGFGLSTNIGTVVGVIIVILVIGPIVLMTGKSKNLKGKDLNF